MFFLFTNLSLYTIHFSVSCTLTLTRNVLADQLRAEKNISTKGLSVQKIKLQKVYENPVTIT